MSNQYTDKQAHLPTTPQPSDLPQPAGSPARGGVELPVVLPNVDHGPQGDPMPTPDAFDWMEGLPAARQPGRALDADPWDSSPLAERFTRDPVLHPALVFGGPPEQTMEVDHPAVEEEADDETLTAHAPPPQVPRQPIQVAGLETANRPPVEAPPVDEPDDRLLVAIGLGMVSSMLTLLIMLFSGYGAI